MFRTNRFRSFLQNLPNKTRNLVGIPPGSLEAFGSFTTKTLKKENKKKTNKQKHRDCVNVR